MTEYFKRVFIIRALTGGIILFIVSVVSSCQEINYAVWGKPAVARVIKTYEARERGETVYVAMYLFKDASGEERKDGLNMESPDALSLGEEFPIVYIGRHSRPAGVRNVVPIWITLGMLAVVAALATPLVVDSVRYGREKKARRR